MWRSLLPARELLLLLVVGCRRTMPAAVMFRPGQRHSFVDLSLLAPEGADPVSQQQQQLDLRQQAPDHDFGFREPLITANAPWERGCLVSSYSSVFQGQPDGRVSLFYQLYCSIDPSQPLNFSDGTVAMVALAESMDGLNWVKPVVNQISFRNSTQNNVVMFPEGSVSSMSELEGASVFRDPRSGKLVSVAALGMKLAVFTAVDARGFEWKQTASWEIGFDDSQSVLFWDAPRTEYALYTRAKSGDTQYFPSEVRGVRRLAIKNLSSPDLPVRKNPWDNDFGQTVLMPDAFDNATHAVAQPPCWSKPIASNCTNQPTPMDMYGATIHLQKNVTPPSYLAFIQRLWHWQGPRPPPGVSGTMLWPGKIDIELSTSNDGLTFLRAPGAPQTRRPLLSVGRAGHWASAFKWALPNPVIFGHDEFLYYSGRNFNHNLETERGVEYPPAFRSGIACVAWRKDGMLALEPSAAHSLDDGYSAASEATTVPLRFAHGLETLVVNLDTGAGGAFAVEIQNAQGTPLPGFALSEAVQIVANSVEARPMWQNRSSLQQLAGVDIRLRFVLQSARLYSFEFKSDDDTMAETAHVHLL